MAATAPPLQTVLLVIEFTFAEGFTIIVNVMGVPLQFIVLANTGVTVIVAVTGDVPLFVATNEAISPVPFDGKPMDDALFVQL